ncbi:hypothetical protein KY360_02480 [Candidatus Woesearchaeota archaeon]|nr:hypothetical protein [Candidatus Woesearchaeota archaeon]
MNLTKRINIAKEHIFSTGIGDGASHLCKENMKYGIAKMHYVQEKLGMKPDATFITTPDETVTRNIGRFEAGIAYGGKVSWGNGKEKVVMLEVKPNTCGMLVGGLDSIPEPKKIIERVNQLAKEEIKIGKSTVRWDFYKGNHFIDIFKVKNAEVKLPKYAVILHAGCPELKRDNEQGFGLYWDHSNILFGMCEKIKTPVGPSYIIQGKDAEAYLKFYRYAEEFAKKRREIAYKYLFNGKKVIANICHQGLMNYNEIKLGCQQMESKKQLLPISIRADLPSYLFTGKKNFTPEQIETLGFHERGRRFGVYDRLRKFNMLPHGGGYKFSDALYVDKVFHVGHKRFYEIVMRDGMGKKIVSNMKELQFNYRNREVILKTIELGLGRPAAELEPVYVVKI